jgi:hypothetical protein
MDGLEEKPSGRAVHDGRAKGQHLHSGQRLLLRRLHRRGRVGGRQHRLFGRERRV